MDLPEARDVTIAPGGRSVVRARFVASVARWRPKQRFSSTDLERAATQTTLIWVHFFYSFFPESAFFGRPSGAENY